MAFGECVVGSYRADTGRSRPGLPTPNVGVIATAHGTVAEIGVTGAGAPLFWNLWTATVSPCAGRRRTPTTPQSRYEAKRVLAVGLILAPHRRPVVLTALSTPVRMGSRQPEPQGWGVKLRSRQSFPNLHGLAPPPSHHRDRAWPRRDQTRGRRRLHYDAVPVDVPSNDLAPAKTGDDQIS